MRPEMRFQTHTHTHTHMYTHTHTLSLSLSRLCAVPGDPALLTRRRVDGEPLLMGLAPLSFFLLLDAVLDAVLLRPRCLLARARSDEKLRVKRSRNVLGFGLVVAAACCACCWRWCWCCEEAGVLVSLYGKRVAGSDCALSLLRTNTICFGKTCWVFRRLMILNSDSDMP